MKHNFPDISHEFPLHGPHQGTTLGNAWLGLSVWGEKNTLNITLGSSALWDHRGGMKWTPRQNYKDIRAALEAYDKDKISQIFHIDNGDKPGQPTSPSIIPVGRITLELASQMDTAKLILKDGLVRVFFKDDAQPLEVRLSMKEKEKFGIRAGKNMIRKITVTPSFDMTPELKKISFPEPVRKTNGFYQKMPADPGYALYVQESRNFIAGCFMRAKTSSAKPVFPSSWKELEMDNHPYWAQFWEKIPSFECANSMLVETYYSGLFHFQSMTAPDGVAAGLQGPWIEDYMLPPWSADYHFNINVEMCYWPAYRSGLLQNLMPLFDLVLSWRDTLRKAAHDFIGINDGYMLPHAVDDRGISVGGWWSGTIDHASTAWTAQMMMEYYDYSLDEDFLRTKAFDFMCGTMNVYLAMLEKTKDGSYRLPVSVSPEFRGAEINAWGANPSFQLAAIHRLAADLIRAAKILHVPVNPKWEDVRKHLPQLTLVSKDNRQIALWEGVPLSESHRHHSHLAAICPFATIDPADPAWKDVLYNSYVNWIWMGTGGWSGWSMPWASMLHNRFGNPDMAELTLDIWHRVYVNRGGGTRHDPLFVGFSAMGSRQPEIMQIDTFMGTIAAIQDMFVYPLNGELHLMSGCTKRWKSVSMRGIICPFGFKADLVRTEKTGTKITVTATHKGKLKVVLPNPESIAPTNSG